MHVFERRVRSFAIDMSFAILLLFVLVGILRQFDFANDQIKLTISTAIVYFGVLIVPNFFSKGQTFGKRTQKMKTVNVDTEKTPSLIMLVLRELFKGVLMIISFGLYIIICGIMATSRKDGRVIHDLVFRTKVICLTMYVNDKKEQGYVLGRTTSAKNNLKGSDYD